MNGAERRERSLRSGLCDGRSAMEEIFARRKARLKVEWSAKPTSLPMAWMDRRKIYLKI